MYFMAEDSHAVAAQKFKVSASKIPQDYTTSASSSWPTCNTFNMRAHAQTTADADGFCDLSLNRWKLIQSGREMAVDC